MSKTKKIALTGLLCALGVVFMMMGGMIPLATFCCPALAGLVLIPGFVECGEKISWGAWFVISVLSLLLSPDKESALLFCFIGYYPIVRWRLEQIRGVVWRILSKLVIFNIAIGVMYALCIFVFRMDAILAEYKEAGIILTAVTLALGNVTLLLYDRLLKVGTALYVNKFRGKLLKQR